MDIMEMGNVPISARDLAVKLKKISDILFAEGMFIPAPNTVYGYSLEEIKKIIDFAKSKGYK